MSADYYDRVYAKSPSYYGSDVRREFISLIGEMDLSKARVLDIGCGQGRHALEVAQHGASVIGLDASIIAIDQLNQRARSSGLDVLGKVADITRIRSVCGQFDICILVTVLDHLNRRAIPLVIDFVSRHLKPGGVVYVESFTVEDPGKTNSGRKSDTATPVQTYFEAGEMRHLFAAFDIRLYSEMVETDHSHGNPHQHGVVVMVAEKA